MRLSPPLLKTSLSFSLVVETSKNLFNSRAEGSSSSNAAKNFWMRAIENPVAVFCIRGGCGSLIFFKPWVERPQYSCNFLSVSRTCALTIEKPSKKFAPEFLVPAQANRIGKQKDLRVRLRASRAVLFVRRAWGCRARLRSRLSALLGLRFLLQRHEHSLDRAALFLGSGFVSRVGRFVC